MTAQDDVELADWLLNAQSFAGDFLRSLAEAGLRADHENYPVLRPGVAVDEREISEVRDYLYRASTSQQLVEKRSMSERIFEANGLYVTSVAQPLGAGPALEFDRGTPNPRLNAEEAFELMTALAHWILFISKEKK